MLKLKKCQGCIQAKPVREWFYNLKPKVSSVTVGIKHPSDSSTHLSVELIDSEVYSPFDHQIMRLVFILGYHD